MKQHELQREHRVSNLIKKPRADRELLVAAQVELSQKAPDCTNNARGLR
jgi:hypothetical protein